MNRLPTTDLYFLNACGDQVARWWRRAPVRALGANTFLCGETLLLVRRDREALMRRALRWPHRLVYLIDDDIAGSVESPGLPDDYRRRLAIFDRDYHRPLVERADRLVVASEELQALFDDHRAVTALDPFWSLPLAGVEHFRGAGATSPIRLAHLGSGSHAGGLALLEPAMLRLADSGRDVMFTFVARKGAHRALDAHPRMQRVDPKQWPRYRRWIGRQRFHIGLYPLAETRFDRARSANKIIEHGIVGAVGVYPDHWKPAQRVRGGAIIAPAAPGDWFSVLAEAVDDPKRLETMAFTALQQLPTVNNATMQRRIWGEMLEIAI